MAFVIICLLVASNSFAQIPAGYYDPASGLTGANLKAALNGIISGHTTYPYTSSSTDVWDILKAADQDPSNPSNVIGIYSGFQMDAAAEYAGGSGWNREHVWAKSRGDFGTSQGAGTDCHHIVAADISTNSARNNRNFDNAPDQYIDGSGNYSGPTDSRTSSVDWVWEPRDSKKGDVARMIFYMATRYEGAGGDPDLELTQTYLTNTDKSPVHARLSTLLAWHLADPVSAEEQNRNDVVYGFQNNRNPYIDHPEYVCQIWTCAGGGNNAPAFTSTAVTSGTENQAYTYNITTTDSDGDPMTISGTTVPSWLILTDNGNGSATLTGTPTSGNVGNNAVVLSVSDGTDNTTQSFTINVSPVGGGGSGATDLFFSEYIEGSSNNKGLEVANFTGSSVDLSTYSIQKQTNGAGNWGSTLTLSGSLADGDVFVVTHSSANSAMTAVADITSGSGYVTFNGNDPVGLFKNGTLIDIIGTFGDASVYAQNVTLVRNSTIGDPTTTYTPSEWTSHPTDTFSFLGAHTFDGGTPPDPCDVATGLASSNIGTNSADLSWSAATGANSYNVRYKPTTSGTWTTTTSGTTSLSISGLSSNTAYEYQVQTVCTSASASYSASSNFSTLADPCDPASGLGSSNITTSGADLSWSAGAGASSYNVRYKPIASGTWTNTTSGSTSVSISGLTEDTAYEFQVQTVCSSASSAYTSSSNFSTLANTSGNSVLISEYVEGSSFNKALEIVNLSGAAIDLSNYSLMKQTNGAGAWTSSLTLSGSLADGSVFVIVHSSASGTLLAEADLSTSASLMTFNGNDPIGLFENGILVDVIGTFDGGSGSFAANQTLVRKTSATSSNTTYTTVEWEFYASDTFTYIGGYNQDLTAPSTPGSLSASNIAETSFDVSWAASTDNVAVTGYDIYLDGSLNGSVSSTSYAVSGLQASTVYLIEVYALDAAGNQSSATSVNVTTLDPPPTGNNIITQSYFESGWDGWTDGGGDCARYSGSRSYEGSYSIRIRDNSSTASSMTYSGVDVSGYDQIEIEFFFYVYSMENGEDFWVRYHDGSSWNTVATYARGSGIENNNFYSATVVVDKASYNFPSNAQFRFQCDASGNADHIYIDQVTIAGITGGAGARLASETNNSKLTWLKQNSEDLVSGFMEIYPNPVVSTDMAVLMELEEEVNLEISIFTIQGREIEHRDWKNVNGKFTHTFDVSKLEKGMYLVSITTSDGEIETKKVLIDR